MSNDPTRQLDLSNGVRLSNMAFYHSASGVDNPVQYCIALWLFEASSQY